MSGKNDLEQGQLDEFDDEGNRRGVSLSSLWEDIKTYGKYLTENIINAGTVTYYGYILFKGREICNYDKKMPDGNVLQEDVTEKLNKALALGFILNFVNL